MKKLLIWMLVTVFAASILLPGIGCKKEALPAEEVTPVGEEEAVEEEVVEEEVTEPVKKPRGEITVWHGDSDEVAKITQDLIETSFNAEYPDIKVNYELAPEPFKEKLLMTIPAGTGPDLFEWNHDWIGVLAIADVIVPIDDLVTPELKDKYIESAYEAGEYKGHQYTLPISVETIALAYNKDLVGDKPVPETTDELVERMEEFKEQGMLGMSLPIVPFTVAAFFHAFGGYLWDDDIGLGVNGEGSKQAMRWIIKTFKPYVAEDASWDAQVAVFPEGKVPYAINVPWTLGTWKEGGIDVGVALLPTISEIGKDPMPYTGVKSIYMTANCDNKEAALAFMEWATTNKDRVLRRAVELGYIPVLKEVLDYPEVKDNPFLNIFAQEAALGKPMASGPEMVAVWIPMQEALDAIWSGTTSVDEALDEAQAAIEQSIAEMQ